MEHERHCTVGITGIDDGEHLIELLEFFRKECGPVDKYCVSRRDHSTLFVTFESSYGARRAVQCAGVRCIADSFFYGVIPDVKISESDFKGGDLKDRPRLRVKTDRNGEENYAAALARIPLWIQYFPRPLQPRLFRAVIGDTLLSSRKRGRTP
jgi:hypothetical protein